MLTNVRDTFRGQSRSPNMIPSNMLGMVFRLDALAKALSVIATATWLAGWLDGWLAVTLRYCIKTAKRIGKLLDHLKAPSL